MQGHDVEGFELVAFLAGGVQQYARLLAGKRVYLWFVRPWGLDGCRHVLRYHPIAQGVFEGLGCSGATGSPTAHCNRAGVIWSSPRASVRAKPPSGIRICPLSYGRMRSG